MKHPSDVLARRYPDLEDVPTDRRGELYFAKIVADQSSGSASAVALGVVLSLGWFGGLALCGTLTAGYLLRRGDRLRALLVPYLELSITNSVLFGLLLRWCLAPVLETQTAGEFGMYAATLLAMALLNLAICVAVHRRFNWVVRVTLLVAWLLTLAHAQGLRVHPVIDVSVCVAVLVMLFRELRSTDKRLNPTPI